MLSIVETIIIHMSGLGGKGGGGVRKYQAWLNRWGEGGSKGGGEGGGGLLVQCRWFGRQMREHRPSGVNPIFFFF